MRGEEKNDASHKADAPPHPDPLPPAQRGGEGTTVGPSGSSVDPSAARRANTIAVIDFVLSHTLRLFHPFLPFITEELWHGMGYSVDMPEGQGGKTIMTAPWPKPFDRDFRDAYSLDDCYLEFANDKYKVVTQGRNLRRIGNIQAGKKVKFILKPSRDVLPHDAEVIKILLNAEALEINERYVAKKGTPTAHTPMGELFLPLEGLIDVEAERARLDEGEGEDRSRDREGAAEAREPGLHPESPADGIAGARATPGGLAGEAGTREGGAGWFERLNGSGAAAASRQHAGDRK